MSEFIFTITHTTVYDSASPPTVVVRGQKVLEDLMTLNVLKHSSPLLGTSGWLPFDCSIANICASQAQFAELRDRAVAGTALQLKVQYEMGVDGVRTVTLIDTLPDGGFKKLVREVQQLNVAVADGFETVSEKLDRIIERLPQPEGYSTSTSGYSEAPMSESSPPQATSEADGEDLGPRLI
jgi:hypothetical protein